MLTLAQLQAYLNDQLTVSADQDKLTADQATETTDAATITAGLSAPVAILSADGSTVFVFTPVNGSFTVQPIPLVTT